MGWLTRCRSSLSLLIDEMVTTETSAKGANAMQRPSRLRRSQRAIFARFAPARRLSTANAASE
jgi:hypothetical protein